MRIHEVLEASGLGAEIVWWMNPKGQIHTFVGDHDEVIGGLLGDELNPDYPWSERINDPYKEALATGWLMGRHVSNDILAVEGDKKSIGKLLSRLLHLAKQEDVSSITLSAFPTRQWLDILKRVDTAKEAWDEFENLDTTYNDYVQARMEPGHVEKLKKWVST